LVGFIVLIALTIGIILHELIHGITWAKYTKDGFKSIRFGVLWKFLTLLPLQEPLLVKHYIIGGLCQLLSWGFFLLYYPLSLAMYFC
jgi:fatty-acid desaturase